MLKVVTLVIALCVAAPAALAQQVLTDVGLEDLRRLVMEAGHQVTDADQSVDGLFIGASTDDDFQYQLIGKACNDQGTDCKGLNMVVAYAADEGLEASTLLDANTISDAVSVWLLEDTVGISRYVILDGGQTMDNLVVNLGVFLGSANDVGSFIWPNAN